MGRFSQRMGLVSAEEIIQKNSMNSELRNSLWTIVHIYLFDRKAYRSEMESERVIKKFLYRYYFEFIKKPIDEIDYRLHFEISDIKSNFFKWRWNEVYDFIEFWYEWCVLSNRDVVSTKKALNKVLARESSAYRIINDVIVEITSEQEINEIEASLKHSDKYTSVSEHISNALSLMSDRNRPDFRNSGKESISAVESLVKIVTASSNGTLGQLIKELERSKVVPPTLKSVYSTLYGYTCEEDGIRHALIEESRFEYPEARYMLIVCSAFVNYVIEIYEQQELLEKNS